jgi:hypothetical protein
MGATGCLSKPLGILSSYCFTIDGEAGFGGRYEGDEFKIIGGESICMDVHLRFPWQEVYLCVIVLVAFYVVEVESNGKLIQDLEYPSLSQSNSEERHKDGLTQDCWSAMAMRFSRELLLQKKSWRVSLPTGVWK